MRNTGIKAIETHYNGYRFRSRLEAKWAVYFDALGIEYEYEPEGFVLPGGETYLPDFYLPLVDAYVEIKSKHSTEIGWAKGKIESLAIETGKYGMICIGDPVDNDIHIYGYIYYDHGRGLLWDTAEFICGAEEFCDCLTAHKKIFDIGIVAGDRYKSDMYNIEKPNKEHIRTVIPFKTIYGFRKIPLEEQEHARQARFEHGECG